ncbi:GNAT family N-acetyltransferase [Thiorhodovibrio frisius]|uniref:Acetyltransferase (GNAT) family protein n=1 Tax=Thiorhodovibrio frisius TaxID=631362 RepID=H8Z4K2_9GAMM|nr:GNAT family N-acetyltransferase [Thiorhodovibrio frisius]EIC20259.1 acetyltransferase (GNAT) family protein [Thiorhodovibrio frisius]WPL20996.1 Acetyltransferase (GNAT) family protein [Thiorhodovibrio frisius]
MTAPDIKISPITGPELIENLPALAALRIAVFREYPYLYDGDSKYEMRYLRTYSESPDSIIVLATDGDQVIGASTAVPMRHAPEEAREPFDGFGIDPDRVFYLGESVLYPQYRGRGIGSRFFEERERHAERIGGFDYYAFCAVERAQDDPRRPIDYRSLHAFWQRRGYDREPQLYTCFNWREIGEAQESSKPMVFWLKPVGANAASPAPESAD